MSETREKVQLTKAQRALLDDLARRPETVDAKYRPGLALVAAGLATGSDAAFGGLRLTITEAGRASLEGE